MPVLRRVTPNMLSFWCPGCNDRHSVTIAPGEGCWGWNGDLNKPSFTPSILVRTGHHVDGRADTCWCTYEQRYGKVAPFKCGTCHSFVTDGQIQFLGDCSHELAGKTVPLPEFNNP